MMTIKHYKKHVPVVDEESTPEMRGIRVKRVRNLANLSRRDMCDDSLININTLKGWEVGKYGGLTADGAERVVKRVAREGVICTAEWLLFGGGTSPYVIPDFQAAAETPLFNQLTENSETNCIINELLIFKQHHLNAVDFQVMDDGLSPFLKKGDYIAGIKYSVSDIYKLIGYDCLVRTASGELLLRNLRAGNQSARYTLVCTNIHTSVKIPILYDVELEWAAPVLRVYRKNVID